MSGRGSPEVDMRVPWDLWARLRAVALSEGVTEVEWVRRQVESMADANSGPREAAATLVG